LTAGIDDAGQQGESTATLFDAGPLAEALGDNPVPQGPFGFVASQRQIEGYDNDSFILGPQGRIPMLYVP